MPPDNGDVDGPAASVDENLAAFDGTTGKLIKDSGKSIATITDLEEKTAPISFNDTDPLNPFTELANPIQLASSQVPPTGPTDRPNELATFATLQAANPINFDPNTQTYNARTTPDGQKLNLGREVFILGINKSTTSVSTLNPKLFIAGTS